jgi:CRISPR/Cas system-associated exonuclease Cas4 (RecB family)
MAKNWLPFASYNLWLQFAPAIGQEHLHCDMKRGFAKARNKEPQVKALLEQDTIPQQIGMLAQRGVYEFHQNTDLLHQLDGVQQIAEILQLSQKSLEIQERVISILKNYRDNPILVGKNIVQLSRGDEGYPEPILIREGNYLFKFYAAIDCIFSLTDDTLHILDFKTGKSDFDLRQGYIYLLAASYLYPQRQAIAIFYNLENGKSSAPISATSETLKCFQIELTLIAKRHQKDLSRYRNKNAEFSQIFPPNPGVMCSFCSFNSICQFSICEVAA